MLAAFTFLFSNDFRYYVDNASFYDEGTPFVELYFMLPRQAMEHRMAPDGSARGKYLVAVNVYKDDVRVHSETVAVEDVLEAGDSLKTNEFIPELIPLRLNPGNYALHTMARDVHSGRISERTDNLFVPGFDLSRLSISHIEIASYVGKTLVRNKFTKLGAYDIVPAANPEFDKHNGIFYTYFEVYALNEGDTYTCQSSIEDLNGRKVLENEAVRTPAPGSFDVVIDYMDVRSLASGTYDYVVRVNAGSGETVTGKKRIHMISETDIQAQYFDEYYAYNTDKLDSLFALLRPLMNQTEIKNYRSNKLPGKRQFFVEFWQKRDPDMSTPVNEFYLEVMDRIRFAEKNYTYLNKGIKSDRGRVLLKYGYPSEIQRSGFSGGTKDHEIWLYEGLRGDVMFVFCDTKGRGYYELIHSNMEGETYNADWKDVLQAGARDY